jgi:rhodanese-related sulfurtransferase
MSIKVYPDCKDLVDCEGLAAQLDEVTLIDLRPAEDFAFGHVKGAKHLDIYAVNSNDTSPAPLEAFLSMFNGPLGIKRN